MDTISWDAFARVELRVGTGVSAEVFENARNPAYIRHIDCGAELGTLKSSAQVTELDEPDDLIDRQVVCVVNFPPKQIGHIQSQCLVTGFPQEDGSVVLIAPDRPVAHGLRLS